MAQVCLAAVDGKAFAPASFGRVQELVRRYDREVRADFLSSDILIVPDRV
jgi:hypothetical protein